MSTLSTDTPRIYVADLAAYNNGESHGVWIDIDETTTVDEVWAEINEMLKPGHEEHAIHDTDNFGEYQVGEYESIENVVKIAQGIDKHGLAFAAYLDHIGGLEYADSFEEAFQGEWDSEKEFAENLADGLGIAEDDSVTSRYFDWDAWTRDIFLDGYTSVEAPGYKVYVFDDNV